MNDNAELYNKNNRMQRRDALQCLESYSGRMKWKKSGGKIIDIGCGDGSVLNLIKNYIPVKYEEILGCDISEKMIRYANLNNKDNRTKFMVVDIEGKLPEVLRGKFDHAFSFYALHWIKDQRTGFRNIYDLLNENGDCLLALLGYMPLFDVYHTLSLNNKWSTLLKDIKRFVSPYHSVKGAEDVVTKLLEQVGFNDVNVTSENKEYGYESIAEWRKAIEAINPFNIPSDMMDDFIKDVLEVIVEFGILPTDYCRGDTNCQITFNYNLLIVYAILPGSSSWEE